MLEVSLEFVTAPPCAPTPILGGAGKPGEGGRRWPFSWAGKPGAAQGALQISAERAPAHQTEEQLVKAQQGELVKFLL